MSTTVNESTTPEPGTHTDTCDHHASVIDVPPTGIALNASHPDPVATEDRSSRIDRLSERLYVDSIDDQALEELRDMGDPPIGESFLQELRTLGLACRCGRARLHELDDPTLCPEVERIFRLESAPGYDHDEGLLLGSARYLLRHGHRPDRVIWGVARTQFYTDEALVMALEYAPGTFIPVARDALRCGVLEPALSAAACLSIIDAPWCRDELLSALEDAECDETVAPCLEALRRSGDAEARSAAEALTAWALAAKAAGSPGPATDALTHLDDEIAGAFEEVVERLEGQVAAFRRVATTLGR